MCAGWFGPQERDGWAENRIPVRDWSHMDIHFVLSAYPVLIRAFLRFGLQTVGPCLVLDVCLQPITFTYSLGRCTC
jgi:hypothetical protein